MRPARYRVGDKVLLWTTEPGVIVRFESEGVKYMHVRLETGRRVRLRLQDAPKVIVDESKEGSL